MSNLVRHAPRFSEQQAAALAQEIFNVTASADLLPSERDQNFRLRDEKGGQFVLKIANATETREVLVLQNLAMTHVAQQAAACFDELDPCPRVCSAPGGEEILTVAGPDDAGHFVRLLTYLPGKPLATVNPHDKDLLFSLGSFLGRIDQVFMDFDHPATHREFHWDLARCGEVVASRIDELDDSAKLHLVQGMLDRYLAVTAPKLANLRTSVIHNDGNDYNVLASPYGRWGNLVSGLIDFGDMVHSHTVNELAIGCAYALMGKMDPLAAAAQVVAGYHHAFNLSETELAVLFDLICMRLCTSVCHSAHQIRLAPDNAYLLISQKPAWELLKRLQQVSPDFAEALFRDACGLEPVPRKHDIVTWLKGNQPSFTPVVDRSLLSEHPPVIDLSVSTPLLGAGPQKNDAKAMTRLIFREMEDAGRALGIGRYDETRLIYTAEAFKVETDTAAEYRTVHLGLDLFARPGEPVYAFMDGVNNVCHVGHCHPRVVAAGQRQMAVLNTNTRYLHDSIVDYAQRLLATFPDPLNVCFFVCSGSEANELALRLARTYTEQRDIITVDGAYHGNTQGLVDISPYKHDGPGGKGAPDWVQTVTMPCGYRGPHKGTGTASGVAYAGYVKSAVDCIEAKDRRVAAFICESMLGCGGQVLLPDGYLQAAFAHVRAAGGVCIADEVQVGFGRAGTHFWAFETQAVVPDIVTLGKPMGNGHPVAAVVTTPEIAEAFHNGMEYFNTYGGNPVSCAVGTAVLDVIETEGLQENARQVGAYLLERLSTLKGKSALIGDVRGLGLYLGVELVTDHDTLAPAADQAAYICNRMKDYGFLISTDGPLHNVIKLKPPIIFSRENTDALVDTLEKVFAEDCLKR